MKSATNNLSKLSLTNNSAKKLLSTISMGALVFAVVQGLCFSLNLSSLISSHLATSFVGALLLSISVFSVIEKKSTDFSLSIALLFTLVAICSAVGPHLTSSTVYGTLKTSQLFSVFSSACIAAVALISATLLPSNEKDINTSRSIWTLVTVAIGASAVVSLLSISLGSAATATFTALWFLLKTASVAGSVFLIPTFIEKTAENKWNNPIVTAALCLLFLG